MPAASMRKARALRLAGLLAVVAITLTGCQSGNQGSQSTQNEESRPDLLRTFAIPIPLFAADSAWNQSTADASVLPASGEQILILYRVLLGDTTDLNPPDNGMDGPWPYMTINYDDYSIPIFRAGEGELLVGSADYDGNLSESNPKVSVEGGRVSVPRPAGDLRPSGPEGEDSDGHLVLYDPETRLEYDLWQAKTDAGPGGGVIDDTILAAGSVDFFDTRGSGANQDGYWSARATGTPLLAGLILPEDVEQGAIKHALACAVPGLRNLNQDDPFEPLASDYVHPVSTTEADHINTNPRSLAAGQRLRLKEQLVDPEGKDLDLDELAPITQMFLRALQEHGAYVVDNSGGFVFYAEDIHTANLGVTDEELKRLTGRATLPSGLTAWEIVMETLTNELESVPLAIGEFEVGSEPSEAEIAAANFEAVENAKPEG